MADAEPRDSGARPLQARAVETRRRLVEAAAELMLRQGYDAFTTNEVSAIAGVSRGAQLHHFPARADLVAAAVEHLMNERARVLTDQLAGLSGDPTIGEVLRVLWPAFSDDTFAAWSQLWVAARTDAELRVRLLDVDRRFTETTRLLFVEHAQRHGPIDPARAELARDFLVALLVGLGFQRLLERERRDVADYFTVAATATDTLVGSVVQPEQA